MFSFRLKKQKLNSYFYNLISKCDGQNNLSLLWFLILIRVAQLEWARLLHWIKWYIIGQRQSKDKLLQLPNFKTAQQTRRPVMMWNECPETKTLAVAAVVSDKLIVLCLSAHSSIWLEKHTLKMVADKADQLASLVLRRLASSCWHLQIAAIHFILSVHHANLKISCLNCLWKPRRSLSNECRRLAGQVIAAGCGCRAMTETLDGQKTQLKILFFPFTHWQELKQR